jgi:hypothetical protein
MNPFQNPLSTPLFSARIPFKPMLLAGTPFPVAGGLRRRQ